MELEVSPHPEAILPVFLPVLPSHEFLLAQHLAVEEPHSNDKVEQQDQVGEDEEFARKNEGEFGVDRVVAEGKHPRGHEGTELGGIDPHPDVVFLL